LEATLEDLGSRHGSWRGTTRLQSAITLAQGDEIRLGTAVIEYRLVMPRDTTIE
jgi:pSer/pThr/pTyr-binding forkhead associated (FHA) protein